jgi:hypothetical protein
VIKACGLQQGGELLGYYIDKNHILRRHLGKPLRQQFSNMYNIVNYPHATTLADVVNYPHATTVAVVMNQPSVVSNSFHHHAALKLSSSQRAPPDARIKRRHRGVEY